jgi:hypothetical protein
LGQDIRQLCQHRHAGKQLDALLAASQQQLFRNAAPQHRRGDHVGVQHRINRRPGAARFARISSATSSGDIAGGSVTCSISSSAVKSAS